MGTEASPTFPDAVRLSRMPARQQRNWFSIRLERVFAARPRRGQMLIGMALGVMWAPVWACGHGRWQSGHQVANLAWAIIGNVATIAPYGDDIVTKDSSRMHREVRSLSPILVSHLYRREAAQFSDQSPINIPFCNHGNSSRQRRRRHRHEGRSGAEGRRVQAGRCPYDLSVSPERRFRHDPASRKLRGSFPSGMAICR